VGAVVEEIVIIVLCTIGFLRIIEAVPRLERAVVV
jgi:hypothetical protein